MFTYLQQNLETKLSLQHSVEIISGGQHVYSVGVEDPLSVGGCWWRYWAGVGGHLNSNFDQRSLAFNEELGFRSSSGDDNRVAC